VAYTGLQTRGPGPLVYQGIAFEHYHKLGNSSQRYYKKVKFDYPNEYLQQIEGVLGKEHGTISMDIR
jgi:hypothetical protein